MTRILLIALFAVGTAEAALAQDAETLAYAADGDAGLAKAGNELGITLAREVSGWYTPGEAVDITVTIDAASSGTITAMGLSETIPAGWTYASAVLVSGALPGVLPSVGDMDTLDFVWFIAPSLPCSFTYRLIPAADDSGTKTISGLVQYRTTGAEQTSDVVNTDILEYVNTLGITLERAASGEYTPGTALDITVTINTQVAGAITALALAETIPTGWTYEGVTAVSGALPDTAPGAGAEGTLDFAWTTPPALPYSFIYTVVPATDASGTKTISGYVSCSTNTGEQNSDIVTTQIDAAKGSQTLCCAGAPGQAAAPFGADGLVMAMVALGLFLATSFRRSEQRGA